MTWNAIFDEGVACYQRGDFEGALTHMNQARSNTHHVAGPPKCHVQQAAELEGNAFIIYDSRAAVHEKLGNLKAALLDSKRVVHLAPDKWQGHARLARLFDLRGKHGPVIKSVDHALSHLQLEDVQMHTQLLELRERAVAAQADAEKRRPPQVAHLYLLGKLPMETLLEILGVLIDEDHTWAIRLSHVCGHWRQILIDTPSVWQTLVLSRKSPLQKVKLWKQRAKNRISHISVDISELDKHSVFAELQDLSWDDLWSLRIPFEAFLEFHRILSDLSIPHAFWKLGELIMFGNGHLGLPSGCFSGPMWRLRTLRLNGVIRMDNLWGHIRNLKELYLDVTMFDPLPMSVFTANPSLEKLFIKSHHFGNRDSYNDVFPICMGNLRFIEFHIYPNPFAIARTITVPSITHFSMTNARADETLLHIASHPSLVQLCIKRSLLSPSTLLTLLSSTPNLETLQVSYMRGIANELLQFLATETTGPLQGLPCRALKHVDVSRCFDLTTLSVYAFVKTRLQHASDPPGSAEKCAHIVSLNMEGCLNLDIEADMLQWFRSEIVQFKYIPRNSKRNRRRTSEA